MPILLFPRDLLSITLLVSGVAKLLAPSAFEASLERLGVSRSAQTRRVLLRALPTVEVAIGAALLWDRTSRVAAVLALVMLGAFTAVIGLKVMRRESADCGCFGGLLSEPTGVSAVLRNLVLIGSAASAAVAGSVDAGGWHRVFLLLAAASTVTAYLLIANLVHLSRASSGPVERGVSM